MNSIRTLKAALFVSVIVCAGLAWAFRDARDEKLRALAQAQTILHSQVLDPAVELLKVNEAVAKELRTVPYFEPGNDILQSYLTKIRRDGVPKNADFKRKIDALMANQLKVLTLLSVYAPHAKAAAVKGAIERFHDGAVAAQDRWDSVPEIFMAGGNLASAPLPDAQALSLALEAEAKALP